MKHSYYDKFKERSPLETVQIIQDFFEKKSFFVKEEAVLQSFESQTWYAHLELYYNNKFILASNGKGVTKEFCLASGYAELYERFCNGIFYLYNPFVCKKLIDVNENCIFNRKGKIISYEEATKFFEDEISYISEANQIIEYFKLITDNQFIGLPFTSTFEETTIHLDPRLLLRIKGSTGMCAGNSFEEAFNQGFSEILEHYVHGIFAWDEFEHYYEIDLSSIQNYTLQTIIKNIENAGNQIHIFDFSYNTNLPVLMCVLANNYTNTFTVNIGAFPVFDIALERILTEIYQGVIDYKTLKISGQHPFLNESISSLHTTPGNSLIEHTVFPEYILLNSEKTFPNMNVFLTGEYSNLDIYNYYKDLCNRYNLKVYFCDVSQIDDIKALWIFSPDIDGFQNHRCCIKANKSIVYSFLFRYYKLLSNIYNKYDCDINELNKLVSIYFLLKPQDKYLLHKLMASSWSCIYPTKGNNDVWNLYNYILNKNIVNSNLIFAEFYDSEYYNIKKYILLDRYLKSGKYTIEQIKTIIQKLGNNITDQDIKHISDIKFCLDQVIFNEIQYMYDSDTYIDYLMHLSMDNSK